MPAEPSDYHYRNIDLGIYVDSTGTIRPTWDVDNAGYWSTTIPEGFFDVRIALDRAAGTVSCASPPSASATSCRICVSALVGGGIQADRGGLPYPDQSVQHFRAVSTYGARPRPRPCRRT